MQFYKGNKEKVSWLTSILSFIRDCIIFILPFKHLPRIFVRILYGVNPDFIFFVHARRREDIYIALPFLVPIRKLLGRNQFSRFLHCLPPFVLDRIEVIQDNIHVEGMVVTSIYLPETLLQNNKKSLEESVRGLTFIAKICSKNTVVGLGGLWPMVTRRGLALTKYGKQRDLTLTNGHCGTLVSLYLTIEKLANISRISLNDMKIVILGAGKMGTNLARALYGKVATITLVDINEKRLNAVEEKLKTIASETDIQKFNNRDDIGGITKILENNHVAVSTTSNLTRILRPTQIPPNTIIIDDSRPEGIPRDISKHGAVALEGGLLQIHGIKQHYDFGFGIDENVFGCLAESFMLAADNGLNILPTLGDVDFVNFHKMLSRLKELGVNVGDFKSCDEYIPDEQLIKMLQSKSDLNSTIPFKNICWIFKVDDLNLMPDK
ncbi:MAG TPA: hypothetical protein DD723_09540 [Candidatus Omnitrophica bacterium]|nr:MAG: hypothetical protein A2Z81_02930 [Omnitrophica WOR_2 bacterium GWA2_45_18]OGX19014.1 MAG: hypothetical protein A2Y04_00660 [Omnitrophica WOR_2 bacterium GWC2_45_7]HBR15760.1 hypothetical protein [Candidatus Omnitrophota bacterium]